MKEKQKTYLIGSILVIIVAIVAFAAGTHIARFRTNQFYGIEPGARQGMMFGYKNEEFNMGYTGRTKRNRLSGQITNISGSTITIKLVNGLTKTITVSNATQYLQINSANQSNLKTGENISIIGQSIQDNSSISAQTIQINPSQ